MANLSPVASAIAVLQVLLGIGVAVAALGILAVCMDKSTCWRPRYVYLALVAAGVWYGLDPLITGGPTTTGPGLLFAAVLLYILARHGHRLGGLVAGDRWLGTRGCHGA